MRRGIANQFIIVTSDFVLKELVTVLRRPKFKTSEDEIRRIVLALIQSSEVVSVNAKFKVVKQDPKDDIIIRTAYDGDAERIVTGDKHLLELGSFRGIKIITVENMIKLL